ncbi:MULTISPECIES: hypothetical protein [Clostridium]|uniref:hypothetical protein n=1 Tax=Clostridium TaxID=1485 RepID=UPI000823FC1B|nr:MULTISPECIES: hypothetical protein [Clostridium]PJI06524.1 hypothetical protein CUB90_00975 [Clostridium sp. CT7]
MEDKYENISIKVKDGIPDCYVELCSRKIMSDEVLLRNLFTLVGTNTYKLSSNISKEIIPNHNAYSSVAIVEEVGDDYKNIDIGSVVLISPYMNKYIKLKKLQKLKKECIMFDEISKNIDLVDATFIPLICKAIDICNDISMSDSKELIVLGCDLLGVIIVRLLKRIDIHPIIIIDNNDIKQEILKKSGAKYIIYKNQYKLKSINKNVKNIINLTSEKWAQEIQRNIQNNIDQVKYYNCNSEINRSLSHDNKINAVSLLASGELNVTDLIGQHVHAEHISDTIKAIRNNDFLGRALVYDW